MTLQELATEPQRRTVPRVPTVRQARQYTRRLGWRRAAARSAYVLVNRPLAVSILDCMELTPSGVNRELAAQAREFEHRFLSRDGALKVAAKLIPEAGAILREAALGGDACYALIEHGEAINVSCFSPRPTPVVGDLVVGFHPPDWYMFGGHTPPRHRGRRLHGIGVTAGALELFERGVPSLVAVCERTNYASWASALRMGWRPCGTVFRVGLGRWSRVGRTPRARAREIWLEPR